MLRRNWWLVLLGALLGGSIAGYKVATEVTQYRAAAVIRLADTREALTSGLAGPSMQGTLGRGVDPLLSQIQVLMSDRVAGAVVDSLSLRLRVARAPSADSTALVVHSRDQAIANVLAGLSARPRQGTDVVDVTYVGTDAALARDLVNTAIITFQAENARASQQQSRRRRIFLEEQLATNDSILAHVQEALIQFRSREQVYSSRDRFAAEQTGLMGLEVRREELDADRRMYSSLLETLMQAPEAARGRRLRTLVSAPGMASNAMVAQLHAQLVQYESALDALVSGEWGSALSNPDVQRLLQLQETTRDRLMEAVLSHMAGLDARIAALDGLRERSAEQFQTLPGTEAEEAQLIQQVETARAMASLLRQEYQKSRVSEAVEAGQVEIVDLARMPGAPIGSGATRTLIFAVLLGLMAGGGIAVLRERLNFTIRRQEDVARVLGLTTLTTVPRLRSGRRFRSVLSGGARNGNGNGRSGGLTASRDLVAVLDNRSSGAEAYRTLRTNLLFSELGDRLKTVVVTSAATGEGKTTVAANLATAFAQQGIRVLLVDADLRKSRLHKVFEQDREPGLSEWLVQEAKPTEAIRRTNVEKLFLLVSGALPENPSEHLGSPRMARLVEALRDAFELVIFDSPPLMAAADAAVLASRADGVVLVVRAGGTEKGVALDAVRQLEKVGARVLGVVLNDPDATAAHYGDYHHYEYYGEGG